jgi:hypothetical protein
MGLGREKNFSGLILTYYDALAFLQIQHYGNRYFFSVIVWNVLPRTKPVYQKRTGIIVLYNLKALN